MADLNILDLYKQDPRRFRRRIADWGLFKLIPVEDSEDFRNQEMVRNRVLFRAVIDRALYDIIESYKNTRECKEAWAWVAGIDESKGEDFKYTCELADLDPNLVHAYIKKVYDVKQELTEGGVKNIYAKKKKVN